MRTVTTTLYTFDELSEDAQERAVNVPRLEDTRTLWFETWHQASAFSRRRGLRQTPEKRPVWIDLAWKDEWSLIVPISRSGK